MGATTRTSTIVFTDLVDSTAQRSRIGDDAADALRRRHDEVVQAAATANDGSVVKNTGDGAMLSFDSASSAIAAAIEIQRRTGTGAAGAEWTGVRIGIAAGDVSVEDDDYFGMPVVEAARICDRAGAGQIFVSALARMLCGSRGDHAFVEVGEFELKGIAGPVSIHEVTWHGAPAEPVPPPLRVAADDPFVGRDAELRQLLGAWEIARGGTPAAAVLTGEPGIGKTRLTATVAHEAAASGALVIYGRCEDGLGAAYQPIAEAIRRVVTDHPESMGSAYIGAHLTELAPLLPGLVETPPPDSSDAETSRYRLFEAVRLSLEAAAAERPVVVVLDDLHWATESTVLLVRHLIATISPCPLLTLLTYRDTEEIDVLGPLLADLARLGAPKVELQGLDLGSVKALTGGAGLIDVESLLAATKGNPFFVRELARAASEAGMTPSAVRDVVSSRIDRLGEAPRSFLSAAAVMGSKFDIAILEHVLGTELLETVERCQAAGLVSEVGDHPGHYRFDHDLVRQTLYDDMSITRRSRRHAEIATALQSTGPTTVQATQVAQHLLAAATPGSANDVLDAATTAVIDMHRRFADDEAVALANRALRAVGDDPTADSYRVAELLIRLAYCYFSQNRSAEAHESADRAGQLALESADVSLLAHAAMLSAIEADVGRPVESRIRLCERALDRIEDQTWRCRVLGALAAHRAASGEGTAVRAIAREALEIAEHLDDPIGLSIATGAVLFAEWANGDANEQIENAERLLEAVKRSNDLPTLTYSELTIVSWQLAAGNRAAAQEQRERLSGLPSTQRNDALRAQIDTVLAFLDGRWDDAMAESAKLGELAATSVNLQLTAGAHLLASTFEQGQEALVADACAQLVDENPNLAILRASWAAALVATDELDAAREVFAPLRADGFAAVAPDYLHQAGLAFCAETCAHLEDRDAARSLVELLEPHAGTILVIGNAVYCPGAADHYRAMLFELLDRSPDEIDAAFQAALDIERSLDAPPLQARTLAWWARSLSRRDNAADSDRARTAASEARSIADQLGMAGVIRHLDRWEL